MKEDNAIQSVQPSQDGDWKSKKRKMSIRGFPPLKGIKRVNHSLESYAHYFSLKPNIFGKSKAPWVRYLPNNAFFLREELDAGLSSARSASSKDSYSVN